MSGHSKFANIKHKKEKNDAAKGKIFTRIGREIAVAVKEGGPDPNNNSKLKDVIAKAKANNMPNDTIDRSIKKAAGDGDGVNYEQVTYEGYGPSGIAIIVDALTDNKNRTAANVRSAFTKGNGNVGTQGCVSFMFDKKGQIIIDKDFIGAVIGPGGKVIQDIQKTTNTTITITENDECGVVDIFGVDKEALDGALSRIKAIVAVPEVGEVYTGPIKSVVAFGAFVEILPGKEALLHISEIDYKRFETMRVIWSRLSLSA